VEDVNTGAAYVKTYRRLIKNPCKQVLMGVQFYMDGAKTGQFSNLQVTAVQCTFTIFNQKAREQDHFWGTLGYVPKYTKEISRGHCMFRESGMFAMMMRAMWRQDCLTQSKVSGP
jgi:hypothetical protein